MLLTTKPAVRIKRVLGDDIYGLWHVKKIVLQKDGRRYSIIPDRETFGSKDDAEQYAHLRARRFVERKLGETNNNLVRQRVMKYFIAAAFMSLMTTVAVRLFSPRL